MIDFIFAGIVYVAVMFVVFFVFSFVTIGITYTFAKFTRSILDRMQRPHPVLK